MRVILVIGALLLAGCDSTSTEAPAAPTAVSSPFVTVEATPDSLQTTPSTEAVVDMEVETTTPETTPVTTQVTTVDVASSPAGGATVQPEITETIGNVDVTSVQTQSAANLLYQRLRVGVSTFVENAFWACSSEQGQATFRMQLVGKERDSSFDINTLGLNDAYVRIASISDTYDLTSQSWIYWRVESGNSVLVSSTRSEFSASNFGFNSISFDKAGNRFSALDSNGADIACAHVSNTSEPYCTYSSPYGACVLAPIGEGEDAIEVVTANSHRPRALSTVPAASTGTTSGNVASTQVFHRSDSSSPTTP